MNNSRKRKIAQIQFQQLQPCICPEIGELLPDYIVELLSDAAAEEVEEHLLFCRQCREDYLTILKIRATAQNCAKAGVSERQPMEGGEIVRITDFKK